MLLKITTVTNWNLPRGEELEWSSYIVNFSPSPSFPSLPPTWGHWFSIITAFVPSLEIHQLPSVSLSSSAGVLAEEKEARYLWPGGPSRRFKMHPVPKRSSAYKYRGGRDPENYVVCVKKNRRVMITWVEERRVSGSSWDVLHDWRWFEGTHTKNISPPLFKVNICEEISDRTCLPFPEGLVLFFGLHIHVSLSLFLSSPHLIYIFTLCNVL